MIIDFRYHVASLVAVFLALGVGILIGGAVLGNAALQRELTEIEENLSKIRTDQRALETEIAKRDTEIKEYTQFGNITLPLLVRDKLLGKRVALIRTGVGGDPRTSKDLARLFQMAGAKITSTTTILRSPAMLPPDKLAELKKKLNIDAENDAAVSRAAISLAADRIANGPMFGGAAGDAILSTLTSLRLVELSGDYGGMVDALILIGGSGDPNVDASELVDRVLIDTLADDKGLLIAAVEQSDIQLSYLPEYLQHPIIVVDNIETVAGQVALVFALVRGKKGHYGVRGAHQLMPEL